MRMLIFAASALVTVTAGTAAKAHAFLDHAEPRVGSTVPTAPRELTLSYTQNLEPAFSEVEVSDANGKRVDHVYAWATRRDCAPAEAHRICACKRLRSE